MANPEDHTTPLELVIVEDDPRLRELLSVLLDGSPGFYCHRAFPNAEDLMDGLSDIGRAIILMDIDLGEGLNGIEAVEQVRHIRPDLDVVMLTVHEDESSVFAALCAGAVGYLIKGLPPMKLLTALEDAAAGGAPMSPRIARRVVQTFRVETETPSPLSKRETEVLGLLCEGESYRDIGESLFISGHTVRSHIKHIYEKLHVHSRAEAVRKAIENKLI